MASPLLVRVRRRLTRSRLLLGTLLLLLVDAGSPLPLIFEYQAGAAASVVAAPAGAVPLGWHPAQPTTVARTAVSRTDLQPDGSYALTLGARPLAWFDGSSYQPFDNTLAPVANTPGVAYENHRNGYTVRFAGSGDVATGAPVVQLSRGSVALALSLPGAAPSALQVSGSQLTYLGVSPGIDLRYTLDDEQVKEELVLSQPGAAVLLPGLSFSLQLSGASLSRQPDGSLAVLDSSGQAQLSLPPLVLIDGAGATSAVPLTVTDRGNGSQQLSLSPDSSWLTSPERVYPVVLDPTFDVWVGSDTATKSTTEESIFQATDKSSCPTNTSCNSTLSVAQDSSGLRTDMLIAFNDLSVIPSNAVVTSATLRLDATSAPSNMTINAYRITHAWSNTMGGGTGAWTGAPTTDTTVASSLIPTSGWNSLDLTALVRGWLAGTYANDGVRLEDASGNGTSASFASSYASDSSTHPQMVIRYVALSRYGVSSMWSYQPHAYGAGTSSQVELSTGNLLLQHQDSRIDALGFTVDLTHGYNSEDAFSQADQVGADYGEGWSFSQSWRLYEVDNGNGVILKDGSGKEDQVYGKDQDSGTTRSYLRPLWYDGTLTKDLANPPADPSKVFTLTSDVGAVQRFFDAGGKLTRVQDRNGNFLSYGYDGSNRLTSITDVAGRQVSLVYGDPSGRLSQLTDMAGRVSTYSYDSAGNLVTIRHGVGTPDQTNTSFGYDANGQLTSVTDPRGHTSRISYDVMDSWEGTGSHGWTPTTVAPNTTLTASPDVAHDGSSSLKIDFSRMTTSSTAPQGMYHGYAGTAALTSVPQDLGFWVYAPAGAPQLNAQLSVQDQAVSNYPPVTSSAVTPLTSGSWSYVHLPFAPIDPSQTLSQIALRVWPSSGSYTGVVYVDQYMLRGVAGAQTNAQPAQSTIASYSFASSSSTVQQPDATGTLHSTTTRFNGTGQPTQVTYPIQGSTNGINTYTYDSLLRPTQLVQTDTGQKDLLDYYPNSKLLQTQSYGVDQNTFHLTETERFGYDLTTADIRYHLDADNETRRSQGLDYTATVYNRDSHGNLLSQQTNHYAAGTDLEQTPLPAPQSTLTSISYTYDGYGRTTSMTDADGNVTNFSYQGLTPYLTLIDASAGTGEATRRETTITPNADGQPSQTVDPKGQTTTYAYDGLGRLTTTNYGVVNGTPAFATTVGYDAAGNTTAMTDAAGSSTYSYNEDNVLSGETRTQNGQTKVASYGRSALDWLTSVTTFSNQTVSYGYNAAGWLTSVTDPNDSGKTTAISYNNAGQVTLLQYPGDQISYSYEGARLTSLTASSTVNTTYGTQQSFSYDYGIDPNTGAIQPTYHNGQLYRVTEKDGSVVSYGYDDLDRLTSAVRTGTNPFNQSYSYDANNNRTSSTDGGVQTLASYDAANQLITAGSSTYGYDADGNLTSYDGNTLSYDAANHWTSGTVNGHNVSYGYDGQGRRVSQAIDGATTDEWYDTTGLTLETGAQNAIYLHSPDGKPLSITSGGNHDYYVRDRLGSITGLLANDGSLAVGYSYDPWGQPLGSPPSLYNPVGFAGSYADTSTGLDLMGARYYQAESGRFGQLDPLAAKLMTGNRYQYANCNPVNVTDSTGLAPDYDAACTLSLIFIVVSYVYQLGTSIDMGDFAYIIGYVILYAEIGVWIWECT